MKAKDQMPVPSVLPVAIIGTGLTSFCLLARMLEAGLYSGREINVFGPSPFGAGAAYHTQNDHFRLNVRAQIMNIWPDRKDDFYNWAKTHIQDPDAHTQEGSFYRRSDFADYLTFSMKGLPGIKEVQFYPAYIQHMDIHPDSQLWQLRTDDGQVFLAEKVVLATGNPEPVWPCKIKAEPKDRRLTCCPWTGLWTSSIPKQAHITLIGGGLTAMDGLHALYQQGHQGQISLVTPNGKLPPKQTDWHAIKPIIWPDNMVTASAVFRFFRTYLKHTDWDQTSWQNSFEALRVQLNPVWQRLDDQAKRRLQRHAGHFWQLARYRSAPQSWYSAEAMIDKGQLQIIKGRVSAIEAKKDAVYLTLGKAEQLIADHVVNCTGAAQNPLAVKMINSGLVAADVTGRAVRVNEGLQIIDKDGQPLPGIWAAGAMTAGSMGDVIGAGAIPKQIDRLISVLQAN